MPYEKRNIEQWTIQRKDGTLPVALNRLAALLERHPLFFVYDITLSQDELGVALRAYGEWLGKEGANS